MSLPPSSARPSPSPSDPPLALADIRSRIDEIDGEILALLARRMRLAPAVVAAKRPSAVPVRIPARIDEVRTDRARAGAELGLDPAFVEALWSRIIEEMCRQEERILGER